jgi:hypothetical protein
MDLLRHLCVQLLSWLEFQLKGDPWIFLVLKLQTSEQSKNIRAQLWSIYCTCAIVYFLPTFWKPKTFYQGSFFKTFCPYVLLVFKSGFWSRAGYSGECKVYLFGLKRPLHCIHTRDCSQFQSKNAQFQNKKKSRVTHELKLKSTQQLGT